MPSSIKVIALESRGNNDDGTPVGFVGSSEVAFDKLEFTRMTCGLVIVAALAAFKNVLPTENAGLGGFSEYFLKSTLGTGGVMVPPDEPPPALLTLTTAAFPRMTVCAGTGDTIACFP